MRFQTGEKFCLYSNGAGTASITLTSTLRDVCIESIIGWSLNSSAICVVQASGTTIWEGECASAGAGSVQFRDLCLENGAANTISAACLGATSALITVIGSYRLL